MKGLKEFTEKALTEVMESNGYITESSNTGNGETGNINQTPEDIMNGSLKFDFYFKEGSEDGAVYFDVSFKRGRKIIRKKDYNMQTASKLLRELNAAGYLLGQANCEKFKNWINVQIRQEHKFIKKHCNIGWDSIETDDGKIEQEIRLQDIYTKDGSLGSEYCGELKDKIAKKGTLESYVEGIRELVVDNPKLETALITGFTGFITQALEIEKIKECNIVLNYTGKTSKGKTTTSKLALTPFGNPQDLIRNFNETKASSELSMVSYGIIPYIMDDKIAGYDVNQKSDKNKLIDEIMALSHRDVKHRCHDKEDKKYCCPIVMSTEESIADAISDTTKKGAYYRFIEIECNNDLTDSGEHAEQLDEFMDTNYGEAGEEFAKYIIGRYNTKTLVDEYLATVRVIRNKKGINHRAAKRMAVIIFTAQLVNECFDLNIDIDKLLEMLNQQINKAFEKSNKVLVELKRLHEYINGNQRYFKTLKEFKRAECLGIYDYESTNKSKQLIIETAAFNHIINDGTPDRYFDFINRMNDAEGSAGDIGIGSNKGTKLIKAWKAEGYILSGGSHGITSKNTSGIKLDGKQRQVYIIDFKALEDI
ncbi:superfamily II helicase [Clostridium aceticum]|uniref:Superfamily II helicase n=1 Tax=Clostridium aceticum TaxID=84022 RepID=A0A0D8I8N3_9CLOT|nr:DUF927 domain-containing protein [Clostridium aceticum]AKL96248.1 superfamily II helicase [Clostridium aceticum]KJF26655.1 hypothetical protein TZ02_12365 [Clostridium aceticum]